MDASAWGVSWLGSWGNSWGPLHEVAETWDTSQGMSRENLKGRFTPIADVEVRVCPTEVVVVSTARRSAWGSSIALRRGCGAQTGVSATTIGVRANAYARAQEHGGLISARWGHSAADASAAAYSAAVGMGSRGASVGGSAAVGTTPAYAGATAGEARRTIGVQNPSDEELAAMVYLLVAKRTTTPLRYPLHSGIKRT